MTKKVFIFDWDGTLADNEVQTYQAKSAVFEHYGKKIPTIEEIHNRKRASGDYKNLYASYGINATREELNVVWHARYIEVMHEVKLMSGTEKLLQTLTASSEHEAWLVTANVDKCVVPLLKKFDLFKFFTGSHFHCINKANEIGLILKLTNVASDNCYYIGDTPSDIRHANSAGVRSISLLNDYIPVDLIEAEKPWMCVSNLKYLHCLIDDRV